MADQKKTIEISYPPDEEDVNEPKNEEKKTVPKATPRKKPAQKKNHKKMKDRQEEIDELTKERDEYKDSYLRNLAEIDNFRKRVKKEKEEFQKFVLSEFFLDFLPIVDNLDRALKARETNGANSSDEQSIVSGVEMIYKQLLDLLKKYNVKEIESLDHIFDPNLHQALSKEEKENITDPIVTEVYQKGFMYNEKLLRPTLAKVAIPVEEDEEFENEEDDTGDYTEEEE
jgi:molecular chaperone GrpE